MKTMRILCVAALFVVIGAAPPLHDDPVVRRFLRYVTIDTQSLEDADSIPSTRKQFDLANLLVTELRELGLKDARADEWIPVRGMNKAVETILNLIQIWVEKSL